MSHTIAEIQNLCLQKGIPFVSYRLPLESEVHTLIQTHGEPQTLDNLNQISSLQGFLVAPFDSKNAKTYLLNPSIRIKGTTASDDDYLMVSNTPDQKQIGEDISEESTSKEDFIHQTEEIKKIISEGKCTKIVLSKVRMEDKKTDFNPVKLFEKLCSIYPHAFVSFLQLPGTGCWIGASPEPLLEVLENSAHTVSLAGSQKTKDVSKKDISWGKKEVEEQAIVTNYIEDVILKLKIFSYKLQGPFTYTAGNLVHLRTSFSFRKSEVENCMGDLLSGLHPTPSVCGLPKKESMDYLQKLEKHKRSYYAGFLGSLNMDNETHLFVNLRCLKVGENDLALYAGAGITSGSNPAKEWDETEEKLKTLLTVIN